MKITPVILSGGSGTRLWPLSTPDHPKQFLALTGAETMFEQTLLRVADQDHFTPPVIVANARHRDLILEQLAGRAARLLLEPAARNTAPAIALAALAAPGDMMLVMPSDHVIADVGAFHAAIDMALPFAEQGWMVTFGIAPDAPEAGYGYIQLGDTLAPSVHKVKRFIEKPSVDYAAEMIATAEYVWNGGIFLFSAKTYLAALSLHAPDMLTAVQHAMDAAEYDGQVICPNSEAFSATPADSIDYAVMEKAERVAVVPVSMGWSDVGSWDALSTLTQADSNGNAISGNVTSIETHNCLIRSDGLRISTIGLAGLTIIASGNDILILPKGRAQDVKKLNL